MDDGTKSDGSWWRTLPGVLTAAAAIITALGGLVVALHQSGLLGGGAPGSSRPPIEARPDPAAKTGAPAQPTARESKGTPEPSSPATRLASVRPWSEAKAVITTSEGALSSVNAESLSNCISVAKDLTLSSGQSIAFEKMRSFEFVRDGGRTTLIITLLSGDTVKGSMSMGCDLFGQNELGRVSILFEKVKRVDFER